MTALVTPNHEHTEYQTRNECELKHDAIDGRLADAIQSLEKRMDMFRWFLGLILGFQVVGVIIQAVK